MLALWQTSNAGGSRDQTPSGGPGGQRSRSIEIPAGPRRHLAARRDHAPWLAGWGRELVRPERRYFRQVRVKPAPMGLWQARPKAVGIRPPLG